MCSPYWYPHAVKYLSTDVGGPWETDKWRQEAGGGESWGTLGRVVGMEVEFSCELVSDWGKEEGMLIRACEVGWYVCRSVVGRTCEDAILGADNEHG